MLCASYLFNKHLDNEGGLVMRVKQVRALLLLISLMWGFAVQGMIVDDLYVWSGVVADDGEAARQEALVIALDVVLRRVASSDVVVTDAEVVAARQQVQKLVERYSYRAHDVGVGQQRLMVVFSKAAVDGLLERAGYKFLPRSRPLVLMWLVVEDEAGVEFLNDHLERLHLDIEGVANRYGLPVVLPLLDLPERLFITQRDIVEPREEALLQAGLRYNADVLVLGKLKLQDGVWQQEWRLVAGENAPVWSGQDVDLAHGVELMLVQMAEQLKKEYVPLGRAASKVQARNLTTIRVNGIRDLEEYSRVLEYLRGLQVVQNIEVVSIADSAAVFSVQADGGKEALNRAISINRILLPELHNILTNVDAGDLLYRVG